MMMQLQLGVLLLASAVLLVLWSFAVPMFETPDEPSHWQYAVYLHDYERLPLYATGFQEAAQPPLYYLLVSPFAGHSELPKDNATYDSQGVVHRPTGVRMFQYSDFDWSKYWPLRTVRLVTALISVFTVFCCYWIGREVTGNHMTGLLAAGLVAFLPQFTFIGMSISNDALLTMLCAATTLCIVRLIRRGFTSRLAVASASVMGLAILSKINALFLPAPFSLAILSEKAPWRIQFSRLGVLVVSFALVLPLFIYNQVTYGDPLASRVMLTAVNYLVDIKPITSPYFTGRFPSLLFQSLIGDFGWMNLLLPDPLYLIFGLLAALSILGYAWRGFSHRIDRRITLILLTIPLLSLALTVYFNLTFTQPQGRYLFSALPAMAALIAVGLEGLPRWSQWASLLTLVTMGLLNVWILFNVIIPAYWPTGWPSF